MYICVCVCKCVLAVCVNVLIHLGRRSSLAQRALSRILEMPFCFTGHTMEREAVERGESVREGGGGVVVEGGKLCG